ncbi:MULTISPECIES: hypothetical protein [unclassified Rhodanobacter]|uniref:Transposase n=1 Tax=Rhodanobacter humi TaxID=1888173 RepID=A0ABV4AVH7_9GAMM
MLLDDPTLLAGMQGALPPASLPPGEGKGCSPEAPGQIGRAGHASRGKGHVVAKALRRLPVALVHELLQWRKLNREGVTKDEKVFQVIEDFLYRSSTLSAAG